MLDVTISDWIPHRAPMLLVDGVLEWDTDKIVCTKTFRADEFFVQGHYPGHPIVPGVILCECAAQSAAILLARYHVKADDPAVEGTVPVLTRMNQVRFKKTVHPGDTITMEVRLEETVSGAYFLAASLRKDGKRVASLELACTLAPHSAVDG